jgi:putative transposase
MSQTLTSLLVHCIFSTKDRVELIPEEHKERLFAYIGGICRASGSNLLAAGGTMDHVHLLINLSKKVAIADLMLGVKRDSSKLMKSAGISAFGWQDGYAALSIGQSQVPALRAYIAKQKEHHRRRGFKEELIAFLEKYGIDYDPEHIWT